MTSSPPKPKNRDLRRERWQTDPGRERYLGSLASCCSCERGEGLSQDLEGLKKRMKASSCRKACSWRRASSSLATSSCSSDWGNKLPPNLEGPQEGEEASSHRASSSLAPSSWEGGNGWLREEERCVLGRRLWRCGCGEWFLGLARICMCGTRLRRSSKLTSQGIIQIASWRVYMTFHVKTIARQTFFFRGRTWVATRCTREDDRGFYRLDFLHHPQPLWLFFLK